MTIKRASQTTKHNLNVILIEIPKLAIIRRIGIDDRTQSVQPSEYQWFHTALVSWIQACSTTSNPFMILVQHTWKRYWTETSFLWCKNRIYLTQTRSEVHQDRQYTLHPCTNQLTFFTSSSHNLATSSLNFEILVSYLQ
jgi:hypothetical protein